MHVSLEISLPTKQISGGCHLRHTALSHLEQLGSYQYVCMLFINFSLAINIIIPDILEDKRISIALPSLVPGLKTF